MKGRWDRGAEPGSCGAAQGAAEPPGVGATIKVVAKDVDVGRGRLGLALCAR